MRRGFPNWGLRGEVSRINMYGVKDIMAVKEIMAENIPGQKNKLGELKGLRENDVLIK